MNDSNSNIIKLKSSDGKVFEIEENCLKRANFFNELRNILNPDEEINIKDVDSITLIKIIEYLKHYQNEEPKEIPKPLPSPDLKVVLNEWDYNYISPISIEDAIGLLNAADHLGIEKLVHLVSAKLASETMNCSIEEARAKFGIKLDEIMTKEELEEYEKYPID